MTTVFSPFAELEPNDFNRAVDVTFLGQVWGTKAALDRMRQRNRGSIVNVGSTLAFIGIPLRTPVLRVQVRVPWILRVRTGGAHS